MPDGRLLQNDHLRAHEFLVFCQFSRCQKTKSCEVQTDHVGLGFRVPAGQNSTGTPFRPLTGQTNQMERKFGSRVPSPYLALANV